MTSTCGTCWREFPAGWRSREQHMAATGHNPPPFECNTCNRYFQSERAVNQHMNDLDHWGELDYECDDCSESFSHEDDLRAHEVSQHFYCDDCDRYFQNYNNIRMHRNSKVHRPTGLACPFCGKTDTNATGLVHHLEQGSCPNAPLDRKKLYDAIQLRDPDSVLTKKLLTWSDDTDFEATELAFNADENTYQCYLCSRHFQSLESLDQHLKSPLHKQDLYHCPNRGCKKSFKILAAVINHLESESCGFMQFNAVQRTTQRVLDPTRMIGF